MVTFNQIPNANANATKVFIPNNDNGIDRLKLNRNIELKAQYLVEKYQSPTSYRFYCKALHELGEHRVNELVALVADKGDKVRNPGAYFNLLASKEFKNEAV